MNPEQRTYQVTPRGVIVEALGGLGDPENAERADAVVIALARYQFEYKTAIDSCGGSLFWLPYADIFDAHSNRVICACHPWWKFWI